MLWHIWILVPDKRRFNIKIGWVGVTYPDCFNLHVSGAVGDTSKFALATNSVVQHKMPKDTLGAM